LRRIVIDASKKKVLAGREPRGEIAGQRCARTEEAEPDT